MDGHPKTRQVKHADRAASSLSVDDFEVHFDPEVGRALARIEAAVHDSKHFSPDILMNLQDYAQGSSFPSVIRALSAVATIVHETTKHIAATGDQRAEQALSKFTDLFYEETQQGKPPYTLVPRREKTR